MNEEKEEGLILYSILIGVILTFVSLIYYQYESLVLWDSLSRAHTKTEKSSRGLDI